MKSQKKHFSLDGVDSLGFSLVELLAILAIIGVMVVIIAPQIFHVTQTAADAKDQRNAQTIASLAAAARTAGVTNLFDTENVIPSLVTGVATNGFSFGISPLGPGEINGAKQFLTNSWPPGMVLFMPKAE